MSEDPWGLEHSSFEHLFPEFARPDFKLPGEEDPNRRFHEVEKRVEELEAVVDKQRRFMIVINACLFALFIALLTAIV